MPDQSVDWVGCSASNFPVSARDPLASDQIHLVTVSAYACLNALIEALEDILSQVGSKYQITFA